MGSCIKALLGSRREEHEGLRLHTSSKSRSNFYNHHCQRAGLFTTTDVSTSKQNVTSTVKETELLSVSCDDRRRGPLPSKKLHSLDINSANYHQLSVLAKISTDEAKAIVNYREFVCGGQFCSLDQLLDVPGGGITQNKLQDIMCSIKVSHVPLVKATNEPQASWPKVCKPVRSRVDNAVHLNFINSANCHQLCVLAKISIRQAETIINYKVHKCQGRLNSIAQLLDIQGGGITPNKLEYILSWTITNENKFQKGNEARSTSTSKLCDQTGIFLPVPTGASNSSHKSRLLSSESSVKIGSWNLECFTASKVSNLGVLEVICMAILMNGLDIVAFQELGDNNAVKKVCEELNHPTLTKVRSWPSRKGKWNFVVSEKTGRMYQGMEYNAFLWNDSNGLDLRSCGLLGKQESSQAFVRKPFLGSFKAGNWTFIVISVHLKSAGWNGEHTERVNSEIELLAPLVQATSEVIKGKQDVILLGDFNMSPDNSSFGPLLQLGYIPIFPANEPTNISVANPRGNHSYDNMWVTAELYNERFTGLYKIVRRGLEHHLIEGKKPGTRGTVSNHCPIWASFSSK